MTEQSRWYARFLQIPLIGKVAGANLVIVLAALVAVGLQERLNLPTHTVYILAVALGLSLVVNLLLVYVALRPLNDLKATAARVASGDLAARVPPSILAGRDMARVSATFNEVLDRLMEDRARVRRLASQVISAQDEERARLARELHDSTAQTLTAVLLQLGVAARESSSPELDARIATLRDLASEALEEVRTMSHMMHPRILDDLGLAAALAWLARQTSAQESLEIRVTADPDVPPVPPHLASVLYRVAQEALRNAVRHGEAHQVNVRLRAEKDAAVLEIVDDGHGFDVHAAEERRPGMGLFSMRERVALVNGKFLVSSTPGNGTRVMATVPLAL